MPELPEVERGRRLAEAVLSGHRIQRVRCADDPIVFDGVSGAVIGRTLRGRRVVSVQRHGKQLWFELDRGPSPLFHFGMTGAFLTPESEHFQLETGPKDSRTWPPRFTKFHIETDDGGELVMTNARRLGRILLRADPRGEPPISDLGFDPLTSMPSSEDFIARLGGRRSVIKSLLLDQSFAAGVGNWIADEALYRARIDPRRRANDLTAREGRRLAKSLSEIVRKAVEVNAESARYPKRWLFHRRWGRNADATSADGEPVEFIQISGRTTAWVPARQENQR